MSDLPRGQARNLDKQRTRRSSLVSDDVVGPGLDLDEDGRIVPAVAGALRVNADDQIELLTDDSLVQEQASPRTLKVRYDTTTLGVSKRGLYALAPKASAIVNDARGVSGATIADALVTLTTATPVPAAHTHDVSDIVGALTVANVMARGAFGGF